MSAAIQTVAPDDTLAVLRAAEEWLSDPEHWTIKACWRRADGSVLAMDVGAIGPSIVSNCAKTCAVGALGLVTGGYWPERAADALFAVFPGEGTVPVNDGHRGYERIMAGLRRAIEQLEVEARP
jgi:hypothetical protein